MVAKTYYNASHFADSFQKMNDLRESVETCDIRLLASNKEFSAHKVVLASASEYFKNSIYGLFLNNSGKKELELKEIQHEILSELLDYMYTGKIEINSENVYDIYNAADYYLMNFIKRMCLEFLKDKIDIKNCVKIWVMANNCKHEKILIAAGNFIISNLKLASETTNFLSLSNEEVGDIFKLWPEDELCDSLIDSLLRWAANNDDWEETAIKILKDISHTRIGENYLENILSNNELLKNSCGCNKWMADIYKDKLKSDNEKFKLDLEFTKYISDQPIFFMANTFDDICEFYKYNLRDNSCRIYNKIPFRGYGGATYKNWIYSLAFNKCNRFRFDYQNEYELAFYHGHGFGSSTAVLNDSIYICGGSKRKYSFLGIDLNTTKIVTSCSLIYEREYAGVAVNDGVAYICGGEFSDLVERFDPRVGRATYFGSMPFRSGYGFCSVATLSNQLHCTVNHEYKIMDIRYNSKCVQRKLPGKWDLFKRTSLFSSYGKLHFTTKGIIYASLDGNGRWQYVARFSDLSNAHGAISFK